MNFPCKLFLGSCLCCLLAMPVQHRKMDKAGPRCTAILRRISHCTRSFIQHGICPIIFR